MSESENYASRLAVQAAVAALNRRIDLYDTELQMLKQRIEEIDVEKVDRLAAELEKSAVDLQAAAAQCRGVMSNYERLVKASELSSASMERIALALEERFK